MSLQTHQSPSLTNRNNRPVKLSRQNGIYVQHFKQFGLRRFSQGERKRLYIIDTASSWPRAATMVEELAGSPWSHQLDRVAGAHAVNPSQILISSWSSGLLMMFTFGARRIDSWSRVDPKLVMWSGAATAMHNYPPFHALTGTSEGCSWSIRWINKRKSLISGSPTGVEFKSPCENMFLIFTFTSANIPLYESSHTGCRPGRWSPS